MIVRIKNKQYSMGRTQLKGVLQIASENVKLGIYAVERKNQVELLNISCKSKSEVKRLKETYKKQGFKVYANG